MNLLLEIGHGMLYRMAKVKIRWLIFWTLVALWTFIWGVEKGLPEILNASGRRRNVVEGDLPRGHGVNLFDRRKPTVILLYSKSEARGVNQLNSGVSGKIISRKSQ